MFGVTILGYTITAIWLAFLLFLFITIALWPAIIAKGKGYSFLLFFIVSIPFWWITFFIVLLLKDKNLPPSAPTIAS